MSRVKLMRLFAGLDRAELEFLVLAVDTITAVETEDFHSALLGEVAYRCPQMLDRAVRACPLGAA